MLVTESDRLGEIRPIIVKAYVVPRLKYDLLLVKGLNRAGYAVNHHPEPSTIRSICCDQYQDRQIQIISIYKWALLFFNLKLEQMSARQFEKQSGYELWHRRLAYASNRNIRDTIKCSHGLESLFETHTKCPSCMIGKATLEDFPKATHMKYSVQTKGGRNSDSAWRNHHENNVAYAASAQNLSSVSGFRN